MRSLRMSAVLFLMLAALAACSSTFEAAPRSNTGKPAAVLERLDKNNGR